VPPPVKDTATGLRDAKGSVYEGGVRVPLIVAGAGVTRRGREDNLFVTSDIYATVLTSRGARQPRQRQLELGEAALRRRDRLERSHALVLGGLERHEPAPVRARTRASSWSTTSGSGAVPTSPPIPKGRHQPLPERAVRGGARSPPGPDRGPEGGGGPDTSSDRGVLVGGQRPPCPSWRERRAYCSAARIAALSKRGARIAQRDPRASSCRVEWSPTP
jgi:hypothetical protein